jgi:phage FluMu protein Com
MSQDDRWQFSKMKCNECGHLWMAVSPVVAEYLECPNCSHMNPAPPAPLKEKEE